MKIPPPKPFPPFKEPSEMMKLLLQACVETADTLEELRVKHPEEYGAPEKELHKDMMRLLAEYEQKGLVIPNEHSNLDRSHHTDS